MHGDEIVRAARKAREGEAAAYALFRRLEEGAATLIYLEGETELEKLIRLFVKPKK